MPAEALRFDAGLFTFDEARGANRPISMLARTAQPIEHWYFGKVVHDMDGMTLAAPTLPIDYCHDPDEILGFLDQFTTTKDGLMVSGDLVSFQPDDRTAEIAHKSDAGVPYQASIAFDPNTFVLEEVPAGAEVTVNGYELQGPAAVIRKWTLVAVSVCPYGADAGTRASFAAADDPDVVVHFQKPTTLSAVQPLAIGDRVRIVAEAHMPGQAIGTIKIVNAGPAYGILFDGMEEMGIHKWYVDDETKPASESEGAQMSATETKSTELTATNPETKPTDPAAEFKATLAKFTAKFGATNGAQWAAEGLSYEAALEKHAAELASQLSAEKTHSVELANKLAALPRGEAAPVSFGTNETHAASGNTGATANPPSAISKFAAGLKMPA